MLYDEAKKLFYEIDIDLSKEQFEKFDIYKKMLIDWNDRINLTAITEDYDVWLKHFVDSSTIYKYIKENDKVIDVGTGAGFPTVPIKILNNNIGLTLLDSLNKRITFLKNICDELRLKDVEFIHGRAEDFGNNKLYREKYDVVTARAVSNLSTLAEFCIPFLKVGGIFICMKAGNVDDEIKESYKALDVLGAKIDSIEELKLPNSEITRKIIIIKKEKSTPPLYPRKAGIPEKKPII